MTEEENVLIESKIQEEFNAIMGKEAKKIQDYTRPDLYHAILFLLDKIEDMEMSLADD
jgi:hypothetical protein